MYRTIFDLGPFAITSWGVMLVVAFVAGVWLAEKRAKKYNIPKGVITDLSLVLIIAGVVGGRTAFVFENWGYYIQNPGEILKVWEGGLIFYGGLGLAILCGIIFLKKKKVKVTVGMDVVIPSVALGIFFGRIGCFLNGCCFGKPTNLPWGIVFPHDSPAGWIFNEPIHPTQIYSSLAGLCIFGILLVIERKKLFDSYLFWMFLVLYSGWRIGIDFLRYYESKVYLLPSLTHNQVVSILILLLSIGVICSYRRAKK
ncbi:prolipoprotein diacylglyceryl transferase [candidate division WOR-3 bacterium]|nr:prolipoprotein diacylglyceryl transferase [candidate division WOR-3 bacterium]